LIRARTTRAKFACGGAPEATVRIIAERAVVRGMTGCSSAAAEFAVCLSAFLLECVAIKA
jgi:hypothetical protein